jgi:hypothetical protein
MTSSEVHDNVPHISMVSVYITGVVKVMKGGHSGMFSVCMHIMLNILFCILFFK